MRWNTLNTPGHTHRTASSVLRAMVTSQVYTGTDAKKDLACPISQLQQTSHMHHGCRTEGCDAQYGDVLIKACMVGALWLARSLQHFTGGQRVLEPNTAPLHVLATLT